MRKQGIAGAVTLALLLVGCSGGGGGSSSSDTPQKSSTETTQSVSGSVTLSPLVSAAAAKSAASTTAVATASATITIHSYGTDGTLIETKQVLAGDQGVFSTQLTLLTTGGYVVIDVMRPDTSGWSKRINYTDPADIDVKAELRTALTVATDLSTPIKASAENGQFKFGVVRYTDGSRKAVAGSAAIAAAKAAGGSAGMDLEIAISASDLPGTSTLKANLLTFDPSNPDDARNFPGDYLDSTGNRLVSVAFDSVEITDDAGNSVAELATAAVAAGKVNKAASTGVTVQRWIPTGSCASVGDFWSQVGPSGAANGKTIPIYTYNPYKGAWDLLGSGTVRAYDTNTSTYTDVTNFDSATCTSGGYYLNIAVSSEDYINAMWNLDYPLLASKPTELPVDVTFKDDAGTGMPGIYADLTAEGLSRASGTSRADGTLRLTGAVTGTTTPTSCTISYWNPYDYSYQSVTGACSAMAITVTKPKICSVTGTITKSGTGVANEYVWAYSANPYAYASAYTGSDGKFNAKVRCDVDMELYVGANKEKVFRADGIKGAQEATDDGSVVTLGTIAKANAAPVAQGYLSSYSVKVDATTLTANVTAYVSGWDADGALDYPLTYTVKGAGANKTGTITQTDSYLPVSLSGLAAGPYNISVEVADKEGAVATAQLRTLDVVADNRPPVISYAYAGVGGSVRLNKDGSLPAINLYGFGYDPDASAVTSGWSCTGCVAALPAGNHITFPGGASGYTANQVLTFTFTANDGVLASTRDVAVTILPALNATPYFSLLEQSAGSVNSVPATVNFTAAAADADGDTLTYTWSVDGVVDASATGSSYTLSIPADASNPATYIVKVEVSDGVISTPISHEFTVTYGNSAPAFTTTPSQSATSVSTVPATVNFTAAATDADGDTLTYTWNVNGVADTSATGSSYALSIPADAVSGTSYTVTAQMSDGTSSISHTFTAVTYTAAGTGTTVILQ